MNRLIFLFKFHLLEADQVPKEKKQQIQLLHRIKYQILLSNMLFKHRTSNVAAIH